MARNFHAVVVFLGPVHDFCHLSDLGLGQVLVDVVEQFLDVVFLLHGELVQL